MSRINKTNISKFSYAETLSDSNGKSSGSRFNAHIVIVTCCVCLIITVVRNTSETLALAGILVGAITVSLGLFGYAKKNDTNDTTNKEVSEQ